MPEEPRTQTSVGMETVDETVNRARQMQQTNTDIPVEAIENDAGSLQMPDVDIPQDTSQGAMTSADQILTANEQRATAERDAQAAQVDEGERAILEGLGALGTQRQTRNQLEDEMGLTAAQSQMADIAGRVRDMVADMADRDDDFAFGMEEQRQRMGARDGTKREFGNFSAEMNLRHALDRRSRAAEIRAATAAYHVAEGNFDVAARQVQTAMDDIYEPIKTDLQMQQFMLQQNMQRLSSAQQETAQARMMSMQSQLQTIERAEDAVNMAVQSGVATPDEIKNMAELSGSPREQMGAAQLIINRGAAQMRDLQIQEMNLSIAASRATLDAKNQPDPMQSLLMSLFDDSEQGVVSFDEFAEEMTAGVMGPLSPDDYSQLEQMYEQYTASYSPQMDKQQRMALLVGTGTITPQQAEFLAENLQIETERDKAIEAQTVRIAQTIWRDLNRVEELADNAGADNVALLDQIEGRAGNEGWIPFLAGINRDKTRRMARSAEDVYELQAVIDSVTSNLSVEALQQMRENSPNGGALGNVTERQLAMLGSLLGNLTLAQNPESLRNIASDINNIQLDAIFGSPEEISAAVQSGRMTQEQGREALSMRQNQSPETLGISPQETGGKRVKRLELNPDGTITPVTSN